MSSTTSVFAAVLLLLVTLLGVNVSRWRMRLKIRLGDGGDERMIRAIRAHANAFEHCVPFILLLLLREQQGGGGRELAAVGGLFVAARLAHAAGMLGGPFLALRLGATLSVMLELWLAVGLLRGAIG